MAATGLSHTDGTVNLTTYVGQTGGASALVAGWLGTSSNHPLAFYTNNSDARMTVTTGGNVGIGTTSPTSKFEVQFGNQPVDNGGGGGAAYFGTTDNGAVDVGGSVFLGGSALTAGSSKIAFGSISGRKENGTNANYAGYLQFATNSSSGTMSERMRISSTGNVGIGTTAPIGSLDVAGALYTANGVTNLRSQDSSAEGGELALFPGGARSTIWRIDNYDNNLRFFNGGLVAATILPGGNVGIGTTSPGATLDVQGSSQWPLRLRNTGSSAGNYWSIGPDTNNHLVVYNQSIVGMYMANGSTTWSSNSDRRVKKNFLPISDALEKTLQLRGLTYHYKTDADTDPRRVGVIAQEVQRVLPEAVSEHDGILAVKYTEIIPLLIEAIKGLKNHVDRKFESLLPLWAEKNAEIAQLKAESAQLKAESAQLRAALCSKFPDLPVCIQ